MKFKIVWLLQPILIALFPVIHTTRCSNTEVTVLHALFAIGIITLCSVLLFFLSSLIYKSYLKGALFSTLCIIAFYSTKILNDYIFVPISKKFFYFRVRYALIILLLIFIYFSYKLFKKTIASEFLARALFVPFLLLNLFALTKFVIAKNNQSKIELSYAKHRQTFRDHLAQQASKLKSNIKKFPDIYFIILDAYLSNEGLQEVFDFDNTPFTSKLEKMGFYLTKNSRSVSSSTGPSVCTTLNLRYFQSPLVPLQYLWKHHNARYFLNNLNYNYIDLSLRYDDVALFKEEDYSRLQQKSHSLWGELKTFLLGNQFFTHTFLRELTPIYPFVSNMYHEFRRKSLLKKLALLEKVASIKKRKFVCAHFLCPHFPYSFDEHGDPLPSKPKNQSDCEHSKNGYLHATKFLNKQVVKTIKNILQKSLSPPIIILQADHGVSFNKNIENKHKILSAFYLPHATNFIPNDACPINNFRFIFNYYFGTKLPILKYKKLNTETRTNVCLPQPS